MKRNGNKLIRLCGIVICLSLLFPFGGCGGDKYNAVLYDNVNEWMNKEFLKENKTYGACYLNENYNENEDDWNEQILIDKTSPQSRAFVTKEKEEFDKIFSSFPIEVNFEKEIILIYIFTTVYLSRPYKLNSINVQNQVVIIEYEMEKANGTTDTSMPGQRCFAVKMNKLEITAAEFTVKGT